MSTSAPSKRDQRLDVIRALAVALVFAAHLPTCPPNESRVLHALTIPLARGGWVGVDLFFALSGYLIAGLLFREYQRTGRLSIGRFLIRRGFKIYPSLWVLVGATLLIGSLKHQPVDRGALLASLLFYGNYHRALWDHFWSLAVEEHFYFVFPVILLLTRPGPRAASPRPWPWLVPGIALLVFVTVIARLMVAYAHPDDLALIQLPTHLRSDALAIGVLLAYFETFRPSLLGALSAAELRLLLALGVVLLLPAFAWDVATVPHFAAVGFSLYPLAGVLMIVGTRNYAGRTGRWAEWVGYVGARSYSLYLWHLPVFVVVAGWAKGRGYGWGSLIAMSTGSALVVGLLFAEIVEIPVLAFRDRLFPSRSVIHK